MSYTIDELREITSPIAAQHGVKSVFLFGSYSTGNASVKSDVDLKIEKGRCAPCSRYAVFALPLRMRSASRSI